ncbi:MAG: AMP-binding enzyme [Varibaculum cambriense]
MLARMEGVQSAYVVGVPDMKWGEAVNAVLVMEDGYATPSLSEVRAFAGRYLARFEVPQRVSVVDSLPVSLNGKATVSALRAVFTHQD